MSRRHHRPIKTKYITKKLSFPKSNSVSHPISFPGRFRTITISIVLIYGREAIQVSFRRCFSHRPLRCCPLSNALSHNFLFFTSLNLVLLCCFNLDQVRLLRGKIRRVSKVLQLQVLLFSSCFICFDYSVCSLSFLSQKVLFFLFTLP